ncbi:MAG: hypothetical protein ACJ8J0_01945 [Longimicrobiaceae bacterium]
MLADPMAILALVLSALGAGGVIRPSVALVGRAREERRRRKETRETPQDFFYKTLVAGLRAVEPDQRYVYRRVARLVSRSDSLTRVPWGSRPFGDVEITREVLDCSHPSIRLSLVDAGENVDRSDGWHRQYLQLSQPLRRGHEIEFVHSQSLVVTGKPLEHFLRWSPLTRCDQVTLQVAFAVDPPREVRYSAHACTGEELEWSLVPLDVITGSFTKHVDDPIPGRYYKLTW